MMTMMAVVVVLLYDSQQPASYRPPRGRGGGYYR